MTKEIRILLASPSGFESEGQEFARIVESINSANRNTQFPQYRLLKWERDVISGAGNYLQGVVNKQIGDYEIFFGMMGERFGTRTSRAGSGTEEEFDRAYSNWLTGNLPLIHFFFRNQPLDIFKLDMRNFINVRTFREKLNRLNVLYKDFTTLEDLAPRRSKWNPLSF